MYFDRCLFRNFRSGTPVMLALADRGFGANLIFASLAPFRRPCWPAPGATAPAKPFETRIRHGSGRPLRRLPWRRTPEERDDVAGDGRYPIHVVGVVSG